MEFSGFIKSKKLMAVITIALISLGNLLVAFGIAAFIMPCDLISGGCTGVALLIHRLTGLRVSWGVFFIDVVMFFFGLVLLGKKFAMGTLLSSVLYPLFLRLLESDPSLQGFTTDPMLSTVFGGLLVGLGVGIVFRVGASTGGTDPVPLVLHKYLHLPLSMSVYLVDTIIILLQAFFSDSEAILYGIVFVLLSSFTVERISTIGENKVQILAVSEKSEDIRETLLHRCDVGCTMLRIRTGLNDKEQQAVMTVVFRRNLPRVQKAISEIDPSAFVQVTPVAAVRGRGFTMER